LFSQRHGQLDWSTVELWSVTIYSSAPRRSAHHPEKGPSPSADPTAAPLPQSRRAAIDDAAVPEQAEGVARRDVAQVDETPLPSAVLAVSRRERQRPIERTNFRHRLRAAGSSCTGRPRESKGCASRPKGQLRAGGPCESRGPSAGAGSAGDGFRCSRRRRRRTKPPWRLGEQPNCRQTFWLGSPFGLGLGPRLRLGSRQVASNARSHRRPARAKAHLRGGVRQPARVQHSASPSSTGVHCPLCFLAGGVSPGLELTSTAEPLAP